jgi:hypothetical protein
VIDRLRRLGVSAVVEAMTETTKTNVYRKLRARLVARELELYPQLRRQLLPVDDRRRHIRLLEEQPAATDEPRLVLDLEPLRIPEPLLLEEVLVERRVRRGARRSRLVALVLVRDN